MNYDTTPTPSYKQMTNNNTNNQKDMYYQSSTTTTDPDSFNANSRPNMSSPSIEHIDEELQQRQ